MIWYFVRRHTIGSDKTEGQRPSWAAYLSAKLAEEAAWRARWRRRAVPTKPDPVALRRKVQKIKRRIFDELNVMKSAFLEEYDSQEQNPRLTPYDRFCFYVDGTRHGYIAVARGLYGGRLSDGEEQTRRWVFYIANFVSEMKRKDDRRSIDFRPKDERRAGTMYFVLVYFPVTDKETGKTRTECSIGYRSTSRLDALWTLFRLARMGERLDH